jgi:1-acyl-sn-glycerol-3-phosphate acyltransferase
LSFLHFPAKIQLGEQLMLIRKIIRFIFDILFRIFTKVEIRGKENIPRHGGGILATNHLGFMDAPLLYIIIRRDDFSALVAKKHRKNPFLRWLVNSVGGIWLNRDEADTQAVRLASSHLKNGGLLGLAPEGTRSKSGALLPAKTGMAYLADKGGVPIYPVAIHGTYRGFHKLAAFTRPRITVSFAEPFIPKPVERNRRDDILVRNTDEAMCRIAAMLPSQARGAYSDHPRMKELLGQIDTVEAAPC